MQNDLSFLIKSFVNHVEQHRVNALELKCFHVGGAPVDEQERTNWQESRGDLYRTLDAVVAIAPRLARSLETAGLDNSDVLRVANIVGESFDNTHVLDARLWVNWPEWKVQLERLAIRAEAPSAEHAPAMAGASSVGLASTEATSTQTDEQPPALTTSELFTLTTLADFDPAQLATVEKIAERMLDLDRARNYSTRTIGDAVRRLTDMGLAERPEGIRQGARLTMKGRRLVPKIAGSLPS